MTIHDIVSSSKSAKTQPAQLALVTVAEVYPEIRSSKSSSKQRRIPAPIKIFSNYTALDEPRTALYSPALPFSSTPKPANTRYTPTTPHRPAPTPPMNRPNSILILSAPNSARRIPTPTEHGSKPHQTQSYSKISKLKDAKNVRFTALQSPAYSNLKSPAYFANGRSSFSPIPYSPKTPDAMSFDDPNMVPESPIEDAPMVSITAIEDRIQDEGQKQESEKFTPDFMTHRGRQFDPETFILLTGTAPSPAEYSPPELLQQQTVSVPDDKINRSTELRDREPPRQSKESEASNSTKNRSSAPAQKSRGYMPSSLHTDRENIMSSYFSPGFRPTSY